MQGDATDKRFLKSLGNFTAIVTDVDWRSDTRRPVNDFSADPFETVPRTDVLFSVLREVFPKTQIIMRVSRNVNTEILSKIYPARIEKIWIDGLFKYFFVYFDSTNKPEKLIYEEVVFYNAK